MLDGILSILYCFGFSERSVRLSRVFCVAVMLLIDSLILNPLLSGRFLVKSADHQDTRCILGDEVLVV